VEYILGKLYEILGDVANSKVCYNKAMRLYKQKN